MAIASTKSKAWMWKTCACKPWNACADCFLLVLLAAQFVCDIQRTWSQRATQWIRQLGGALGLSQDRNGLYVLLHGIAAVWQAAAIITFARLYPFPTDSQTCG